MANAASNAAETLTFEQYVSDFEQLQQRQNLSTLKLECAQYFAEAGNESWEAFERGDFRSALTLADDSEPEIAKYFRGLEYRKVVTRRVRVVAEPISPYLWWESHILKLRAAAGEQIRVVTKEAATRAFNGELEELLFLGDSVLYKILYDASGECFGASKLVAPQDVQRDRGLVEGLFSAGEDFLTWFDRAIPWSAPGKSS